MFKFIFGVFLVVIFSFKQAHSEKIGIFEDHKIRSYSPVKVGVKDMLFDVRIKGIKDLIRGQTAITSLDDVYFRVYWYFPDRYKVVVEGLPEGFKVLRNNLKIIVKPYIDLIFSEEVITQFSRYPYVVDEKEKNSYLKKKTTTDLSEINVKFNKDGLLKVINSKSPYSRISTEFDYSKKSWSKGKFVTDKIIISEISQGIKSVKEMNITHGLISGTGLPESIVVTERFLRDDKEINRNSININFSNYVLNTGKARSILQGKKQ